MSTTLLVDGNAVAYTINIYNCIDSKDFAKQFFDRIKEYAKMVSTVPRCIICFDYKTGGTWRDELFPEYQKDRRASRQNMSEEQKNEAKLRSQYIKYIREQLDSSKFGYLSYPHTETDDMVALYCNNIQEDGETVIILTTDKDLFQLIKETGKRKVQVLFLNKRSIIKKESEGKDILERKIMLGDPSDSIPSVCSGVGPKYYPDFKIFLKKMKENNIDPRDKLKAKQVSESLGIKYINSFSNFDIEQLKLNKILVDLTTVCENDEKANYEKTNYIKENLNKIKISPFSLYSIKLN